MKIICPHCLSINNVPKKETYKKANCGKCKNSLLDSKALHVSSDNIDKIIENSEIPVILDFWAPWCAPCSMMAPVFEEVAKDFALKATFGKVNTQDEQFLASRFKIRSIPTLCVFKNGKEVHRVSGAMHDEQLTSFVNQFLD
ncbi:MAG TPA: thioredoxin TrxC [Sulfurospirillum sp. UBA11407]|jgi:thioredoxin 2|nr:MAG TPA: thioredoxin TrxC [Sulfurospirillum sp. UBA11407]DAB34213.1 MAG TPA: thioredoxin TrxC [Sulfurospirillum sp. UBA12182]